MTSRTLTLFVGIGLAGALIAGCGGDSKENPAPAASRPSVTVRVDDKRISGPARTPAGYVDFHIVTAGQQHHHLAFWHLDPGVTSRRFIKVLKQPNGDPFKLGTAIGGNGPMLGGRFETTMRLVAGTVVFADIVEGPTTRIGSFRVTGPPVSNRPPRDIGTVVNRNFRFELPADFGRPGVYRFTNPDPVAHDGAIFPLVKGKTAADVVQWMQSGGKGPPPALFDKPNGGPGAIGARWTSWFTLPKLPRGRYVLACFLPTDDGVLHAEIGMVADFAVN
jgi:hypothetical protein